MILTLVLGATTVFATVIAYRAIGERNTYEARDRRARLALARALRSWQYDANQGEGIADDLMPEFCRLCSVLGIVVTFPDGGNDYRYTLSPTFTDYIQAHDGEDALPVLPPLEARDRTTGGI